jgi:cyclase
MLAKASSLPRREDGRVVKGVRLRSWRGRGGPVEIGERYDREEADELVFLDITARTRSGTF